MSCFLSSCGLLPEKTVSIFTMEKSREKLNLKTPTLEEMEKLRWIVITRN